MNKIETLKKNYEFKNVIQTGKYYVKKQIIVYITKNINKKSFVGIAISTKTCNAVKRNFIKRKIKESYRSIYHNVRSGYNIVFMWNKKEKPEMANFQEIKAEMIEAFKDADILINR